MMNHSQWISALVLEQVLLGKNLDKSFELIFRKYNSNESENLPQIKDMVYGAIRELGKSSFYIKKLVPKKIDNQCLEALLHIVLFQISHERSNNFTLVNQAVDAAKKIDHKKSSFINALAKPYTDINNGFVLIYLDGDQSKKICYASSFAPQKTRWSSANIFSSH